MVKVKGLAVLNFLYLSSVPWFLVSIFWSPWHRYSPVCGVNPILGNQRFFPFLFPRKIVKNSKKRYITVCILYSVLLLLIVRKDNSKDTKTVPGRSKRKPHHPVLIFFSLLLIFIIYLVLNFFYFFCAILTTSPQLVVVVF